MVAGTTAFGALKPIETVFINLLRSPGIYSQPGRPVRQPYLLYRPARLHRVAESILRNRLDSCAEIVEQSRGYTVKKVD